jgi:hypothetical protein
MTKTEVLRAFREDVLPSIDEHYSKTDRVARREAWNNYTDALCKGGQISLAQYESWSNPF